MGRGVSFYLFLLIFFWAQFCTIKSIRAESTNSEELDIHALEDSIPKLMTQALIPGLSIAVIRDGNIRWYKGFGWRDVEKKNPVTIATIFEAASLSKPVFSYAVLRLVERNQLNLDKPLMDYVTPEYIENNFLKTKIKDPRFYTITARMILSHTSGFPNWRRNDNLQILNDPGTVFQYSGEGFGMLQKVVEKITGLPLNNFISREVFVPLGMDQSSYIWKTIFDSTTAWPHDIMMVSGKKRKPEKGHTAATLHTTAVDYARFLKAIINHNGLKAATCVWLSNPKIIVDSTDSKYVYWGLGFGLEIFDGETSIWHWGDNGDFKCFFMISPEQKSGVVYFTNSSQGLVIRKQIIRLTMGGDHPALNSSILRGYGDVSSLWSQFLQAVKYRGLDAAFEVYTELKKLHDRTDIIPEYPMNALGYYFLRKKQYDEAIKVFKLNVEIYPESFNVYDSLGEAYLEKDELELARTFYQKSIELNPQNENGYRMLEKIEEKL
jgi:CubicO group peptidase (beta-lactamase class C family)